MDLSDTKSLEQLADYLRKFVNSEENASAPYDFNGVTKLLGALVDNIGRRAVAEDLKAMHRQLTPWQVAVLIRIATVVHASAFRSASSANPGLH